ncbi:MAG: HAD family hydrolase [Clostridium sp.]|nr:HAD family hydrolase [Clostridium sp.]
MYKNYIFDLYGTLVDIHTDEKDKSLWSKLALFYSFNNALYSGKEIEEKYHEFVDDEKAKITDTEYKDFPLERVFKRLYTFKNVNPNEQLITSTAHFFRITSMEYVRLYEGAEDLLKKLKSKGKKVYLLSNAQRIFTIYEMKSLGIEKYFDDIFISSDNFACKPYKKFYMNLINKHDIDVNESIMIGNDLISDIKGAQRCGIDTLYIKSNLSPEIDEEVKPVYEILDGNVNKIAEMIVK